MTSLRHHILRYRATAALLLAAALLMRVMVPAGFMPHLGQGTVTIILCTGTGSQAVEMAIPGMSGSGHHDGKSEHDRTEAPCVFSGLSAPALSGADPILLAGAILFIMLLAVRIPDRPRPSPVDRLRPPLRGPPAIF